MTHQESEQAKIDLQEFTDSIPTVIKLDDLTTEQVVEFRQLLEYSAEKGWQIELANLLLDRIGAQQIISLADEKHKNAIVLLKSILQHTNDSKITNRIINSLPEKLTWQEAAAENDFLSLLIYRHFGAEIHKKLPSEVIEYDQLSPAACSILAELVGEGYIQEVKLLLPHEISLNLSPAASNLLISLARTPESISEMLPDQIDLHLITPPAAKLFEILINETSHISEICNRIQNRSPKISQISEGGFKVLNALLYASQFSFSTHVVEWVVGMLKNTGKINDSVPGAFSFLYQLFVFGYQEDVVKFFPTTAGTQALQSEARTLLEEMYYQGWTETVVQYIEKAKHTLRSPISASDLPPRNELDDIRWPDFLKQLRSLPFNISTEKELKHGWRSVELDKTGSQTRCYLQNDKAGNVSKIVFRNYDIDKESLAVYKKATAILPGYVSSPKYWELEDNPDPQSMKPTFRSSGFREVYAGPALTSLSASTPTAIWESIHAQANYIYLALGIRHIDHGHPHDNNYNIRFLVINQDGSREVSFELKKVLDKVYDEGASIVPIVILRDWDKGTSGLSLPGKLRRVFQKLKHPLRK